LQLNDEGMDVQAFAASARALILENPRNYLAFGSMWFLVKALLRKLYEPAEIPLLGDYVDQSVIDRMPKGVPLSELLERAAEEYSTNMRLGTPASLLEDDEGETFTLSDPDMGD
jgi:hypothetical protein